jgi:hypothetical protein
MGDWLRKPILHFWLIGLLVYFFNTPEQEPRTVQYPDAALIKDLRGQWLRSTGRAPSDEQMQQLIQHRIDQEILLAEALRLELHLVDTVVQQRLLRDMRFMGEEGDESTLLQQAYAMELHVNDEVARRRLVQAMESILRAAGENKTPNDESLKSLYEERIADFTLPPVQSFNHVFISRDKHGEAGLSRAQALVQQFTAENTSTELARSKSEPFLSGLAFNNLSQRQIARHFGDAFAGEAFNCALQQWCGPIESAYGWHVLQVAHREEALKQDFGSVKDKLIYMAKRKQGDEVLAEHMRELRDLYEVQRS